MSLKGALESLGVKDGLHGRRIFAARIDLLTRVVVMAAQLAYGVRGRARIIWGLGNYEAVTNFCHCVPENRILDRILSR